VADAVVIGAGPNGLAAACRLQRAGLKVLLIEANNRPGGALWTEETTLPGHLHDVGAAFVAFSDSPAFAELDLQRFGLRYARAELDSAHPGPDGTCPAIGADVDATAPLFGADADRWRALVRFHRKLEPKMLRFLGPLPVIWPAIAMGPISGTRLARAFLSRPAAWAERTFQTDAARRVVPAMGLHVDVGPDDRFGMPTCWMLAFRATTAGFAVPLGGARSIARAMVADFDAHGGEILYGSRVERIVVRDGTAAAVVVNGREIDVGRFVLADTSAPSLFLDLLGPEHVGRWATFGMRRARPGWGTFKVDFALSREVPWAVEPAYRSAVVHVGDSLDDLRRFTAQVRAGELPDRPYLVVGQQSLVDPSRAPEGRQSLYVYTHVPSSLDPEKYPGGWPAWREQMADRVQQRIEDLAPGLWSRVMARSIQDPTQLEAMSSNLVGGDLGGGSNRWSRQLFFRPLWPWYRYRTPVPNVYLASSYAHPGPGIHGLCGWNAAGVALETI
jgi:phytoene dehydrogenase-like protein